MTEKEKIDYEKAFNALAEAVLRLKGKKGHEFLNELGLFLKGGMVPMPAAEVAAKKKRTKEVESFFAPFTSDKHAAQYLVMNYGYSEEEATALVAKWRKLASDRGYTGPILWIVKAGFTLKQHAPLAGPCHEQFMRLQDRSFHNDNPTANSLVFFIPRIVATEKDAGEQRQALAELRKEYDLPVRHLRSFGSAALLSGLILEHYKRTDERVPLNSNWVRTDVFDPEGNRFFLGDFCEGGLDWTLCRCRWPDGRSGHLGIFPLGVVKRKLAA